MEKAETAAAQARAEDIGMPNSDFGLKLNEKLFDVLFAYTSDDAMRVVEAHAGAASSRGANSKSGTNPAGAGRISSAPCI